jgi:hypothetical protein
MPAQWVPALLDLVWQPKNDFRYDDDITQPSKFIDNNIFLLTIYRFYYYARGHLKGTAI